MAKKSMKESYAHAIINVKDNTITEIGKDTYNVYNLTDFLKRWDNIEDLTISISQNLELPSEDDPEENEQMSLDEE